MHQYFSNFLCHFLCVFKVGDSIVHKARETLERAIKLVNDTKKWGARVVYGDTDRLAVICTFSVPSLKIHTVSCIIKAAAVQEHKEYMLMMTDSKSCQPEVTADTLMMFAVSRLV